MILNAIIVDDEIAAQNMLRQILHEHCPNVNLIGVAGDVKSAVKLINKHSIDLVFLDIEMPEENGFCLFEYFNEPSFETVFCTAFSEFALKAFEVSAIDYILKPVSVSKVLTAVSKAEKMMFQNQISKRISVLKENLSVDKLQKIALPMADNLMFVELDEILFFEADGSYTQVVCKQKKILVSKKIKEFDELLSNDNRFYRVHRSYLINTHQIMKYNKKDGAMIEFANGYSAPIAREKVKEFDEFIAGVKV